jgi:N-acetylmuramoyl-L-alanine amidase
MFLKKIFIGSLSVILCSIIFCTSYIRDNPHQKASKDTYNNKSLPTIIIDAGHGGEDGGAISCTGRYESHLNLEIALRLNAVCHLLGHETKLIRQTDQAVYTTGKTLAEKKVSDLKQRVKLVNETDRGILISIHQNTFSDDRYSGAQVFYANTDGSKSLAELIQQQLVQFDSSNHRRTKAANGVYLMQHIKKPGVLIECGFLSNPIEEAKLRSEEYQKKLCCAIAVAIHSY